MTMTKADLIEEVSRVVEMTRKEFRGYCWRLFSTVSFVPSAPR